ncbi:YifB family Mg chelatase-like AAA ATPase [Ideonella livida]|uniref:YifB family Mg chelatase-like AAA ATPase n=1 Tax=Ideonella livida TaxID=2707176 RepID=A0A7C9PFZ0_9BURK|nr:YifB family Mg chelatase-like AAA ATPase [Ideonella livida]NDY90895.1 YifB family Mg chelatase-like AAA ATPase [Ideonella livida]
MALARVHSRSLEGLLAPAVEVEVHLSNGLPSLTLVGLADTEVKEARERVRAALQESGLGFPHNQRVTVNLAPADLPKESGRFDLPIAVGILTAQGLLPEAAVDQFEFAGELSLAGELRPVRGALALALAARRAGGTRCLVLPHASAREAAKVPGVRVRGVGHLGELVLALQGPAPEAALRVPEPLPEPPQADGPDLADVKGQAGARRALEVAAAGGHSLLLSGVPGSGKSMLAQRLAGLLPPMSLDEALSSAALMGLLREPPGTWHFGQRPMRSPHHSASAVALVGGGGTPRPGEISLAHGGVLFLDELPEFPRSALEALREPLETGEITISRAARQARFPARFQLVAAMNPCPCGWLGAAAGSGRSCRCTPDQVARYQARLSGPLLDRIDLTLQVPAMPPAELLAGAAGESSQQVRERVVQARARQLARQGLINHALPPPGLDEHCRLAPRAQAFLNTTATRLGWSGRALHRVLRVARTCADLAASPDIDVPHLAEAIQYRRSLPGA